MHCNCDGAAECPVGRSDSSRQRLVLASIPVYGDCAATADQFIPPIVHNGLTNFLATIRRWFCLACARPQVYASGSF